MSRTVPLSTTVAVAVGALLLGGLGGYVLFDVTHGPPPAHAPHRPPPPGGDEPQPPRPRPTATPVDPPSTAPRTSG
ncbi:hypothetical protein BJP25_13305 [Actinokineospora bangkokensis]|uniref:Uncharacterized protein n=1 Tax=Actinokineospora bangkokensis TaxID=1193682 RepID=A0A1Q9LPN2_9PSEU|nr:hypothetical protein BJP25_13305 [Actinokineospora bangkokensis]